MSSMILTSLIPFPVLQSRVIRAEGNSTIDTGNVEQSQLPARRTDISDNTE